MNKGGLVIISDLHFGNHKQWAQEVTTTDEFPGCNSRMYSIINAVLAAYDFAVEQDAEAIIVAGDVFHERKVIEVAVFNAVYRIFASISKQIPLYVIPGNHDMVDLYAMYGTKGLVSVYPFKDFCTVVYKPTTVELKSFNVMLFPFNISAETIIADATKLQKESNSDKINVAVYHHSVDGAVFGSHQFKMPHPLSVSALPVFDLSFSGHYHMHQTIPGEKNSLTYVGSLLQHNFGERDYDCGFVYIDTLGNWSHISNSTSPRFNIYELETSKKIQAYSESDYNLIRWYGSSKDAQKVKEQYKGAFVHTLPKEEKTKVRTSMEVTDSADKLFQKYVEVKLGDSPKAKPYLDFGVKLYKESQ